MAKSKVELAPAVSTLPKAAVTTIVTEFAKGYRAANAAGMALANFFAACSGAKLPEHPSETDVCAITDAIAAEMAWIGTPREKQNKSDCRAVLRGHAFLPEAMQILRAANDGRCGYHDVTKLARALPKHDWDPADTVAALMAPSDSTPVKPDVKFGKAVLSYWKSCRDGKRKDKAARMTALETLAKELKLDVTFPE